MKKIFIPIIIAILIMSGCAQTGNTAPTIINASDISKVELNGEAPNENASEAQPTVVAPPQITPTPEVSQTPEVSSTPEVTQTPEASPTPETSTAPQASASPSPSKEATPKPTEESKKLSGKIIGLDPGHQGKGNSEKEPQAPNSDTMKAKVTSGTAGVASKVDEHTVNLAVALKVRDLLEEQGAEVIMTRTSADVDISNVQRAKLFNEKNVNLGVRIHCNGSENSADKGAFMLVPTKNPYLENCNTAAKYILEEYIKATELKDKGITKRSDQTGFNWCERLIVNIEMGHMSNPTEDELLTDKEFQSKMAKGIYNGIVKYFENI